MRASTLTFIFIIFEYSIITGGDGNCGDPPEIENAKKAYNVTSKFRMNCSEGYLREAGTSNLFKCENNKWKNSPSLKCIRSPFSPTQMTTDMNYETVQSTSTVKGKVVFTTTNKASTTSRTSPHTSQRTTTMEETSVTTSITARITAPSTTEKEKLHDMCTTSSHITTSTEQEPTKDKQEFISTVAGGIIVIVILGVAAAVAILLLRRRSRPRRAGGNPVDMTVLAQGSDQPLINPTMISCPPDSSQSPITIFKVSSESMNTDSPLSA
ncbi:hypothetical protein KOW79_016099 [Hemibagrus wyckioides]|uniref:Sushi domain-containing protein n=1 Tax=Hemibagrus wyckioides TaxID=337641 RepID=A0A9D3NBD8_9TELE|nr:interleukin-15 receptor subunit alpha-like isoform X1 [Hemibagrus wyckioides]KAG7320246.1 hypothetical protein KOW79_016099 [Hemibagrus wyckioides]